MILNANKIYRAQSVTLGIRQHVAPRPLTRSSKQMFKYISLTLCFTILTILSAGKILQWQTVDNDIKLKNLEIVESKFTNENINLLATKARLTSRSSIEKVAGNELYLFPPDRSQIYKL